MTIGSTTVATSGSTGNGSTTQFSFSFSVEAYGSVTQADQIEVIKETIATGAEVVQTVTTHYTTSFNADQAASPGGSITMVTAPSSSYKIWIRLVPSFLQATDYQNQGGFLMETVEDQADQHQRQINVLLDRIRRAPRASIQAGSSFSGEITGDLTAGAWPTLNSGLTGFEWTSNSGSATSVTATGSTTARTLANRFAEVKNVKDYGATGDGTTDDTTAINAAIAALGAGGGFVDFPQGTYVVSSMLSIGDGTSSLASTKQNITLRGVGIVNGELSTNIFGSRLKFTGAASTVAVVRCLGPLTCQIIGLTLDCNLLALSGLYATHTYRSRFTDLYVTNYMGSAYKIDAHLTHAQCTTGAVGNVWDNIYCAEPGTTTVTAFECGVTASSPGNLDVARNIVKNFGFRTANNSNANGIKLSFCDIVMFENGLVHAGVAATSCNAKILRVTAPTGNTTFPQAISFRSVALIGDSVSNWAIDAGWTATAADDAGIMFWPFLKADVESCTNPVPTYDDRLWGVTDEGEYFGKSAHPDFFSIVAATPALKATNNHDSSAVLGLAIEGDRATPAANDIIYADFKLSDSAGNQDTFARFLCFGTTVTSASEAAQLRLSLVTAGTLTATLDFTPTQIKPVTNDGVALGSASLSFSDLFLAFGAVLNIANSDWVATHSTGILTVGTGDLRVTTAGTNTASVVTVGGTQTLTNKTLTAPAIGAATGTSLTATGALTAFNATAIPAGGTAGAGVLVSSTANFGVFFGSGAPTLSAAKGSLYLRSDGSGIADRMYVNTNGSTTWTAVATAA